MQIDAFDSHGVTINHPIDPNDSARPTLLRSSGSAHMVTGSLEPGGNIGRHPAVGTQLLMVISGELEVSGDCGQTLNLAAGQAVLFHAGEQHESVARTAATIAILESSDGRQ